MNRHACSAATIGDGAGSRAGERRRWSSAREGEGREIRVLHTEAERTNSSIAHERTSGAAAHKRVRVRGSGEGAQQRRTRMAGGGTRMWRLELGVDGCGRPGRWMSTRYRCGGRGKRSRGA
jgi:hypothetical protein